MFTDPTGMSRAGGGDGWWKSIKRNFSLSKIKSDIKRINQNTCYKHFADWMSKHNPFNKQDKPQNKIRSTQEIGISARSKNGGNENPRTTGKYKDKLRKTELGSFNADYALGTGSTFGGPYTSNNYSTFKGIIGALKNVSSGWGLGETGGESTVESAQDVYKHTMRVIKTYEIFASDGTIDSIKTEYKNIELEAKTQEELKMKIDSADYDNKVEIQRRDAWLQ